MHRLRQGVSGGVGETALATATGLEVTTDLVSGWETWTPRDQCTLGVGTAACGSRWCSNQGGFEFELAGKSDRWQLEGPT